MWPVSARTPQALGAQAERLYQRVAGDVDVDLGAGLQFGHHPHPASVSGGDHRTVGTDGPRQGLLEALGALSAGRPHPQLHVTSSGAPRAGKTVFVFAGQGGQYPGMAARLCREHRVFAAALDACDQALRPLTGWSVREVLARIRVLRCWIGWMWCSRCCSR